MVFFVGEYARQLDERGRFILPAKIREKLSGTVYITKAPLEKCLNIYTEEEWKLISEKIHNELPSGVDITAAKFIRKLFAKASECEPDKQGRISLTDAHIEAVGLVKDIVLVGANNKIEIWSAEEWNRMELEDDDTEILVKGLEKYELFI